MRLPRHPESLGWRSIAPVVAGSVVAGSVVAGSVVAAESVRQRRDPTTLSS
ncbi:hypothetical protein ACLQ20_00935 [Micromonospora sp. DT46]|uniref:hypothetical protein n=1 Tax=Micromonospora sp. DT46 TaxID=3393435 RepID=UPI003CF2E2A4